MCRLWLTTDNLECIVARVSGCKVCAGCELTTDNLGCIVARVSGCKVCAGCS